MPGYVLDKGALSSHQLQPRLLGKLVGSGGLETDLCPFGLSSLTKIANIDRFCKNEGFEGPVCRYRGAPWLHLAPRAGVQ